MLDAMELCGEFCGIRIECGGQRFGDAGEFYQHLGAFAGKLRHAQRVTELGAKAGIGIPRDGDVIDVFKRGSVPLLSGNNEWPAEGNPAAYFTRLKRSSSTAATSGRRKRWRAEALP